MARVRHVIDDGVSFYEHQIDKDDGITLFHGQARFVGEHAIECGGERVEFEHSLIAVGARPRIPAIPGLDRVPYATSDDLLQATELPEHLVCRGAGAVALEFAQIYRRLGAQVTVVQRGARIATLEEPELSGLLRRYLEEEGVEVITEAAVERAETVGGRPALVLADGRRVVGNKLLVGVGRVPVVDGLGLAEIGIETRPTGVVVEPTLCTTVQHVSAIGDATGGLMFTHVATYEAALTQGSGGAYLRQEGLYSSQITEWRRLRDAGVLAGKSAGAKIGRPSAEQAEIARLRRQLDLAQRRLSTTEAALDIMGKTHALLEEISKSAQDQPKPKRR